MRILIVEDESAFGNLLKSRLEAEAYAVDWETDGERGLFCARTNDYAAIILDDILPGRRGFDICRELRRDGRTTPILFMSVQGEIDTKVESLDIGADDYLAKPFSYAELSARLRALLRRPLIFQPAELRVHDLVLDTDAMSAVRNGKRIYLTTKEYALLHYLMRNAGHLVSRSMILEHVWDGGADPFSNAIEAHIYNLRQKIDRPGLEKIIKTMPGRGYILFKKDLMPFMLWLWKEKVECFHKPKQFSSRLMKEIMEKLLTDPSLRSADDAEQLAVVRAEFLDWD